MSPVALQHPLNRHLELADKLHLTRALRQHVKLDSLHALSEQEKPIRIVEQYLEKTFHGLVAVDGIGDLALRFPERQANKCAREFVVLDDSTAENPIERSKSFGAAVELRVVEVDLDARLGGVSYVLFELVHCRVKDHELLATDHRWIVSDVVDRGESQAELSDLLWRV